MKKRKILFCGLLVCGLSVFGEPIKSMLGADGSNMQDDWTPTAEDYIQDGLIYLWDSGTQIIDNNYFVLTIDNRPNGGEIDQTEWTAEVCLQPVEFDTPSQVRFFFNNAPFPFLITSGSGTINGGYPPNGMYNGTQTYNGKGPYKYGRFVDVRDTTKLYSTSTTSLGKGGIKGCIYKDGEVWNNYDGLSSTSTIPIGDANYHLCSLYSNYPQFLQYMNSVRVYCRALSKKEILHNNLIDKMRFGL